jgi:hypothetical protein
MFTTQPVTAENTLAYQNYLEKNLVFPFLADRYATIQPTQYVGGDIQITGVVTDLADLGLEFYGVLCDAKRNRRTIQVPLADIHMRKDSPNQKLIEEYQDWFWNNR